mmetsp:Transcript_131200/g.298705  ORF Transcript_131200/g.298705 Transcript_131200/m.298705 type:complete len:230 (-) Transcript_131200:52-741(-)
MLPLLREPRSVPPIAPHDPLQIHARPPASARWLPQVSRSPSCTPRAPPRVALAAAAPPCATRSAPHWRRPPAGAPAVDAGRRGSRTGSYPRRLQPPGSALPASAVAACSPSQLRFSACVQTRCGRCTSSRCLHTRLHPRPDGSPTFGQPAPDTQRSQRPPPPAGYTQSANAGAPALAAAYSHSPAAAPCANAEPRCAPRDAPWTRYGREQTHRSEARFRTVVAAPDCQC